MFIPNSFPFITSIEEGGDGGGGSEEFNLGVPDDYGQDQQQESNDNQDAEVKDNPAWQEVYDLLPAEFHKQIQPKLAAWDSNFAKVQSQYAPYKPLIERNIPFEAIQTSLDFANLLNANPKAVWDELGQRFGFSGQGQKQVEEEDQKPEVEGDDPFQALDLSQNPQFAQLQKAYQQLEQKAQQQEQAAQQHNLEQQAVREINSEWQAIESRTGSLPFEVKAEIIRRSVFIADQKGPGAIPNLQEGYADYANFVSKVRNQRANNSAPDVLPGNGAQPSGKKSMGKMTEDEFVDHIAQMAQALAEGNQ
jgi:hypothetical protein